MYSRNSRAVIKNAGIRVGRAMALCKVREPDELPLALHNTFFMCKLLHILVMA